MRTRRFGQRRLWRPGALALVSSLISGCTPDVARQCTTDDQCGTGEACVIGGVCARSTDSGTGDESPDAPARDVGVSECSEQDCGSGGAAQDALAPPPDALVELDGGQRADAVTSSDVGAMPTDASLPDATLPDAVMCEAEICDNRDNDCDGQADEGVRNACDSCGDLPAERCDGTDDDCDGNVDEGVLNACNACGPIAAAELCDGIDQNCDGSIDEGAPCAFFESCREGRCQESPVVFEAERDFEHADGRPERGGWCGGPSAPAAFLHLIYGPYARDLPQGRLVATFWLLIDDDPRWPPETNMGALEIVDADQGGQRLEGHGHPIIRSAFAAPLSWQPFPVIFENPGQGHRLEFRINWENRFYLCVDRVEVTWAR